MRNLALILANVTHQHGDDAPMARGFRYSGRGMRGESCPGFTLESLTEMLTFGGLVNTVAAENGEPDIGDQLSRAARTDSMGHGFVLYFPSVCWDDYDGEMHDLSSGVDGVDQNEEEEEEEACEHVWNDDTYCSKCGADGRA